MIKYTWFSYSQPVPKSMKESIAIVDLKVWRGESQPWQRFPFCSHNLAPSKAKPCHVFPLSFSFTFFLLNLMLQFYDNSSNFGKCLCPFVYSSHTDSTINVDVNFGVNFGSWLVLTLYVRLMAFMSTSRINVNIIVGFFFLYLL